jgi:hypothetical protein
MFTPVRRCTNGKGNEASLLHPEHCVPKVTNTWGWGYTHSCCHLGQQHMHTFFPEPSLCFLAHPLGWTDVSPLEDCKFHLWRTDVLAQKTGAGHMCMGPLELWLLLVQDLWDVWCHPVGPLVPPHGPKVLPCEQPLHVVLQPLPLGFPQHKPQPHFSSWAVSPTLASPSALMCGRKVPWRQQRQGQQCVYCNRFSCGSSMQKGLQHLCAHVCMLRPAAWPAASIQQLPAKRPPALELSERRSAKAWQLHHQWGGHGGLDTRGKVGDSLAAHWDHRCSPQWGLVQLPSPMATVVTGGGYVSPVLGSTTPVLKTKKKLKKN